MVVGDLIEELILGVIHVIKAGVNVGHVKICNIRIQANNYINSGHCRLLFAL